MLAAWQNAMGNWPIADEVRNVVWVKALLESLHLLGIGMVLFAAGMIALRFTGLAAQSESGYATMRRFAPWIWGALVVVFVTGIILLAGAGRGRGMTTPMFQLKMVLLLAAMLATAGMQIAVQGNRAFWNRASARGLMLALVAPACFLLWMAIVCAGRWLSYGYMIFPNA